MDHLGTLPAKTTGGTSGTSGGGKGTTGTTGGSGGKGTTGGTTGKGSTGRGSTGGSSGGKVTVRKPADLADMPPVTVVHPDGTVAVLNMADFCHLPNASTLNTVAYSQCLGRKKDDGDDVPGWVVALLVGVILIVVAGAVAAFFTSD